MFRWSQVPRETVAPASPTFEKRFCALILVFSKKQIVLQDATLQIDKVERRAQVA